MSYDLSDMQLQGLHRALIKSLARTPYGKIIKPSGALIASHSIYDELYVRYKRTLESIWRLLTHPTWRALREKGYGDSVDNLVIQRSFELADIADRLEGTGEVDDKLVVDIDFQKFTESVRRAE